MLECADLGVGRRGQKCTARSVSHLNPLKGVFSPRYGSRNGRQGEYCLCLVDKRASRPTFSNISVTVCSTRVAPTPALATTARPAAAAAAAAAALP